MSQYLTRERLILALVENSIQEKADCYYFLVTTSEKNENYMQISMPWK